MQGPAEAAAARAAILEELRKASETERDAEINRKEAEARRAAALHKLLKDEHHASMHAASSGQVRLQLSMLGGPP